MSYLNFFEYNLAIEILLAYVTIAIEIASPIIFEKMLKLGSLGTGIL